MKIKIENWHSGNDNTILSASESGTNNRAKVEIDALTNPRNGTYQDKNKINSKIDKIYHYNHTLFKKAQIYIGQEYKGVVMDLGAGRGTCSAIMTSYPEVQKVYAVEYAKTMLEEIFPYAMKRVGGDMDKMVLCHGSFNNLKVPNNSVDYVVEGGSFHHSEDIIKTIEETFRVLRPGGWFVGIERSWPNNMSNKSLDAIRLKELSPNQKKLYGIPLKQHISRATWGEHEYRHCDWQHYFSSIGFTSHLVHFHSLSFRKPYDILKLILFKLIGNRLLKQKIDTLNYPAWFMRKRNISIIMCQKPL